MIGSKASTYSSSLPERTDSHPLPQRTNPLPNKDHNATWGWDYDYEAATIAAPAAGGVVDELAGGSARLRRFHPPPP